MNHETRLDLIDLLDNLRDILNALSSTAAINDPVQLRAVIGLSVASLGDSVASLQEIVRS